MSIYDKKLIDSDLDAFKNVGQIFTRSVTVNQNIGAGGQVFLRSAPVEAQSPDFFQVFYDNTAYHNGKFKPVHLSPNTAIQESITGDGSATLFVENNGNQLTAVVWIFNPYNSTITVGPTTFNFLFVPYESTF